MSAMSLFIVSGMLMIIFFLEFRREVKEKNVRVWLFYCLSISIPVFAVLSLKILMQLLNKFCLMWIATAIAGVISLVLMLSLLKLVDNEIKKFKSLIEKDKMVKIDGGRKNE